MIRFMDGTPVPADYLARLGPLLDGACADDPGEAHEPTTTARRITDLDARRIASDWHGGGGTALYALASTGAIDTARADHNAAAEIADATMSILQTGPLGHLSELGKLMTYVVRNGPRGPVAGWADLTW